MLAALLAAYVALWLVPTIRETNATRDRLFKLQGQSGGGSTVDEKIRLVTAHLHAVDEFLAPFHTDNSPEVALSAFLRDATLAGEQAGISFSRLAPRSMRKVAWMTVNEVEFEFSGKTQNILQFLRTLENRNRKAVVKTLRLTRETDEEEITCQAELMVFSDNSGYSD